MSEARAFRFGAFRRFHFVGIGGIGMSGLAEILLRSGYQVSGSDKSASAITRSLKELGADISKCHLAGNVGQAQVLVASSAIPPDNPELVEAKGRKLPVIHRSQLLCELMRQRDGITVAGTHGKTTVTSMLACILLEAGADPTVLNGARLRRMGSNARLGRSRWLLAEADESDRSFLRFSPLYTLVTNIDEDHLEAYRDFAHLKSAFREHLSRVPFHGCAVICADDPCLREVSQNVQTRLITYGLEERADCFARDIRLRGLCSACRVFWRGREVGELEMKVPGRHNVLNALGAAALCMELGIGFEDVRAALADFRGAERRTELKGERDGVWVMDDYGHHPTEIRATLRALRTLRRRLLVVYQPHRYTRTGYLMEETAACFEDADRLYLMDVYAAGEEPVEGVNSRVLAERIGRRREVRYAPKREDLVAWLREEAQPGDLLLTLGAGDVWKIGEEFIA